MNTTRVILSILAMACGLNAATVNIALTNFTAQSFASNTVLQLFYTNQPTLNGSWVQAGVPVRISAPYGVVSTNLLAGAYQLTVVGQYWSSPLNFNVPDDTNTYSLTQLATNATVVTANAPHVLRILSGDTDAATVSSNAGVYTLTVIGGGSTNGITSATATNIAAYQAKLATNDLAAAIPSTNGFINAQTGTNIARAQLEMVKTNDTVYAKSLTLYSPDNTDVVFARVPENESGWYLGTTFPGEIGEHTVSVGDQNDADGESSSVFGLGNITYANNSTIVGNQNIIGNAEPSGGNYYYAFGVGNFMTQNNTNSGVIGNFNIISPVESEKMLAIGVENEVYQGNSIAIGYGLHNTNAGTMDIGLTDASKLTIGTNLSKFRTTVEAPAFRLGGSTITEWPTGGTTAGITNGQDNVELGGIGLTNGTIDAGVLVFDNFVGEIWGETNIADGSIPSNKLSFAVGTTSGTGTNITFGDGFTVTSSNGAAFIALSGIAAGGVTNMQDNVRLGGIGLTNGYLSIAPGVTINSEDNASFTMSHALTVNGNVVADAFDGGSGVLTNFVSDYASVGGIGFTNSVITIGTNTINDEAGELRIESPSLTVAGSVNATEFDGGGSALTNLSGANIQAGTINSNALDSATLAALWGGGGGSQTPWTSDINGGGYQLTNVGGITATSLTTYAFGSNSALTILPNGKVGVKTSPSLADFHINGTVYSLGKIDSGGAVTATAFIHSIYNRWYSSADGAMRWTKSDGTSILFAVTNGTAFIPNGITVKGMAAEPTAVPGSAQIYAVTNGGTLTDLYAQSDDGVETLLSPHASDAPSHLYDAETGGMKEMIVREKNDYLPGGMVSFINQRRLAKITELNTRAILYLAGSTTGPNSNALQKLKDMTPQQRQIIVTETYAQYNARTGANLKPKIWDEVQAEKQAAYDAERALIIKQREWLTATNAALTAAGDTNLVELPIVPEAKRIIAPKPAWMK